MIRTVLGDIDNNDLGFCHCHEHLFIEKCKSYDVDKNLYIDDFDKSKQEIMSFLDAGGKSFVDAQPFESGRMAENLQKVSKETGCNIVAVTGFHKLLFHYEDSYIFSKSCDEITRFYISEIELGMLSSKKEYAYRTDAKAGLVKVAVEDGDFLTGEYAKLFEAAANTAKETGVKVFCHLDKNASADKLIEYFYKKGISEDRLIICHLDRARYDFAYHTDIVSSGAFLEYDTIKREKYHSDKQEIELIQHMVSSGYKDNILLGLDTTGARLKAFGAEFGLDYILKEFTDMMISSCIKKEIIDDFMVNNPKRALDSDCR